MAVPDLEQIAEVILLSEGYKSAKELGRKVVSLYSLSRELLSPQQHYDWGLRALKTVLRASGHLLQVQGHLVQGVLVSSNDFRCNASKEQRSTRSWKHSSSFRQRGLTPAAS